LGNGAIVAKEEEEEEQEEEEKVVELLRAGRVGHSRRYVTSTEPVCACVCVCVCACV